MNETLDFLRREERLSLQLKLLYQSYGYKEFKLSSFDEYSLYAENQNFLAGRDVICFQAGEKLLALRPDVTLSIAKNYPLVGGCAKLYYHEKVFRKSSRGGQFTEVSQIGVEVIGEVDLVTEAELCHLMHQTLSAIGRKFVLNISHMGIVRKAVEAINLTEEDTAFVIECVRNKNTHDFLSFCSEKQVDPKAVRAVSELIALPSSPQAAKNKLTEIGQYLDIAQETDEIYEMIGYAGEADIQLDFSLYGDLGYYNGIIFKGYVQNIPQAVLSGGRYDKLLNKFSKPAQAIGFALYLGELAKYIDEGAQEADGVLLYHEHNAKSAFRKTQALRAEGNRILMSRTVPQGFNGKIFSAEDGDD